MKIGIFSFYCYADLLKMEKISIFATSIKKRKNTEKRQ